MNSIVLTIAELKSALIGLGKVIAKRSTLPVLSHLKLERDTEGWIALTATDLHHFVTVRMAEPNAGTPIVVLVPFVELLKITKNCQKSDSILIRTDENPSETSVTVQYPIGNQVAESKLRSIDPALFPEIPRMQGEPVVLNESIRTAVHQALECASTDESRLILNGAFVDTSKEEGHYIVGTNGSHLFSSNSFKLPLKPSVIIPSHRFLAFKEFNQDGDWQLRIYPPQTKDNEAWLQLSSRRWRFIARQIEGNYPNWRQVIPEESSFRTSVLFNDPDALADTIERLPDHDPSHHAIGIERSGNTVHLLFKSDKEEPWMRTEVDHDRLKGDEGRLFLNRNSLIKALRFGLGWLQFSASMDPMRFSNGGQQMIVMPVREESAPEASTPGAPPQPEPTNDESTTKAPPKMNTTANPPIETRPALECALEKIETLKTSHREAIRGLSELGDSLKQVQREHKAVQSLRSTLEKLQSVKL